MSKDLLKSMLQSFIANDEAKSAQELHQYFVEKTRTITGLQESHDAVYVQIGFDTTGEDMTNTRRKAYLKVIGSVAVDEVKQHEPEIEEIAGLDMDHVAQNVAGENYVPGSAFFDKVLTSAPAGKNVFTVEVGDYMAA